MSQITISIAGGSGYTGGELIRILLFHPKVNIQQVTSERFYGKFVSKVHPNLRKRTDLKFCAVDELQPCDVLFLCLPHGQSQQKIDFYKNIGTHIIDLSADFRMDSAERYKKWYKHDHHNPEILNDFVYGIPELHREEMKSAKMISSAGCNATASILALYPLFKNKLIIPEQTVCEVKVGSSEGGNRSSDASHHPIRSGVLRSFSPTGHRHMGEVEQELDFGDGANIHFSATSIDMVRGILATCHVFLKEKLEEKDIWKVYRQVYGQEPFIRIVKERDGNYRFPEPKILAGTNFCDIGFQLDPSSNRLVVISAIDNLMKGAAGQAVQALNLMMGFEESTALEFPGLHPI